MTNNEFLAQALIVDGILNAVNTHLEYKTIVIRTYDSDDGHVHMCSTIGFWEKSFDSREDAADYICNL